MKYKKLLSAFLAAALTVATVLPGAGAIEAKAADIPEPVKTFSFENDLGGSTMKTFKNEGNYTGNAVYESGKSGQAIRLDGNYGLQMNTGKIGRNYTVSLWVNPSENIGNNGSILFMGAPKGAAEYWTSFSAMENNGGLLQLWTNGGGFAWSGAIKEIRVPNNEWTLVTLTQSGNDAAIYINGEQKGTGQVAESYNQDNSDLYIGVNHWDALYKGLVDEVQVYDQTLSAEQVFALYDTRNAEEIFAEKGFTVNDKVSVYTGKIVSVGVKLPVGVDAADAEIAYTSSDNAVATVKDGVVTGVKAGTATITTKVTVGKTEKSLQTAVTVSEYTEGVLPVVAKYTMDNANGAAVADISGNNHNATIVNPNGTSYVKDGERSVLKINSGDSYLTLPMSIYDALTNKEQLTIEAKYSRESLNNSWLFCLGSKAQGTGSNYLFYAPNFGGNVPRAGIEQGGEALYNFNNKGFMTDRYYTITMVVNNGTISIYADGVLTGTPLASGKSVESVVQNGTQNNILGFIGKSCWQADPNFTGSIDEFTVYNAALTEEQIFRSGLDTLVSEERILGDKNESLDGVAYKMNLFTQAEGCQVAWTSSDNKVIAADGTVTNPATDKEVTLIATVTKGQSAETKTFNVTVKALDLAMLEKVVEEAKAFKAEEFTEASYAALETALAKVPEKITDVKSQEEAYALETAVRETVSQLVYDADYREPWDKIEAAAPKEDVSLKEGASETLFTLPESLKNNVTVSYSSDNEEVASYTDGKVTAKKAGTAILTLTVTAGYDGWTMEYGTVVTVTKEGETPVRPFVDVTRADGDWYYDAVYYNYDRGLMKGVDPTHFEPLSNLARAQFAIILHNMEGNPSAAYEPKFKDVADKEWYTEAIMWASSKEIVTGYTDGSETFGWGNNILREQMAVMMYRYAKNFKKYDVSDSADFDKFEDAASVSEYAKEAMKWAVGSGIITGKYNGTKIDPQGYASRAECAIIMQRFLDKYEK